MAAEPLSNDELDNGDEAGADTVSFAPDGVAAPGPEPTAAELLASAEERGLRLQAELQNVLNRTRREIDETRRYAALGVARDMLPALDNIDRALDAAKASGDESSSGLAEGFRMVREQIAAALARHGCEPVDTTPGTEFDPALHEAILHQPSDAVREGAIVLTAQAGYRLHDRVVRAAQVIVSSGPSPS